MTTKLEQSNFLLWQTLAFPILRGYKHLTSEKPCTPKFITTSHGSGASSAEERNDAQQRDSAQQRALSSSSAPVVVNSEFEKWLTIDLLLLDWL